MLTEWLNQFKPKRYNHSEISLLDIHLAQFLTEKMALDDELAIKRFSFLILELSRQVRAGHVCLDLSRLSYQDSEIWYLIEAPDLKDWQYLLQLATEKELVSDGSQLTPLILINNRLYFQRMWFDEKQVAAFFKRNSVINQGSCIQNSCIQNYSIQNNSIQNCQNSIINNRAFTYKSTEQCRAADYEEISSIKAIIDQLFTDQVVNNLTKSSDDDNYAIHSDSTPEIDWQKVAVAVALTRKIAIISGGPGTGKTTTVAKILAGILLQQPKTRIVTAAPTGKAASRLTESLTTAFAKLALNGVQLSCEAITLHRLLGAKADSSSFVYNRHNPLHLDLLVIDEASMVDLNMMARVIDALPEAARLILLGDKDQLSSVEAGAVFGDLCALMKTGYTDLRAKELTELTGYAIATGEQPELQLPHQTATLADSLCLLQKSYRFNDSSGIGFLATAVNAGEMRTVKTLLNSATFDDINHYSLARSFQKVLADSVNHYKQYLQAINLQGNYSSQEIAFILQKFAQYRLLSAVREGPYGVVGLNREIELQLAKHKFITLTGSWYVGRPVMILRNSRALGLFNGDIGIAFPTDSSQVQTDPNQFTDEQSNYIDNRSNPKLRVYFPFPDGSIRGFSPFRLPEHETAYVMTVHKSQGSEFDHVNIVLPNEYTPILNRSLLYTAITRAKKSVTIYANDAILSQTIKNETERESGLVDLLLKI
ncbi:exodeoxyribonuclease V subunit alpha [Orbaceae bacterium ESL0721]|nr:exodeoxyribonuclease V subunit alpha [Orbaceae bacterium ESL0721]